LLLSGALSRLLRYKQIKEAAPSPSGLPLKPRTPYTSTAVHILYLEKRNETEKGGRVRGILKENRVCHTQRRTEITPSLNG